MFSLPSEAKVYLDLEQAIKHNKRPANLLFAFLSSGTREANLIGNNLTNYRRVIKLLTSPKGRKWFYRWMDDTMNYLQKMAEQ